MPCNMNKSDKYEIYKIYYITHGKYEINLCEQNRAGTAVEAKIHNLISLSVNNKNYLISLSPSL